MTVLNEAEATSVATLYSISEHSRLARTRWARAIAALAAGRSIILCDSADSTRNGTIVYAAEAAGTAGTAFAIRHSSGFLRVALPSQRCEELGLTAQCGADIGDLAQCVTVDAVENISTGISAADRATTARLLADPAATRDRFSRPGHVVPTRAHVGLDPWSFGTAEAAVQLVTQAGAAPAAVLAEVVDPADAGSMATGRTLDNFAYTHGLPLVGLDDLALCSALSPLVDIAVRDAESGRVRVLVVEYRGHRIQLTAVGELRGRRAVPVYLEGIDTSGADRDEPRLVPAGIRIRGSAEAVASVPNKAIVALVRWTGAESFVFGTPNQSGMP